MPHTEKNQHAGIPQVPTIHSFPLEVGADYATNLEPTLCKIMQSVGCKPLPRQLNAGLLFEHQNNLRRIIIDMGICQRTDLEYIDYTQEQNELMRECAQTLRFAVESPDDTYDLAEEIEYFLLDKESDKPLPPKKRGRDETHPDPSTPEERFECLFNEAFGEAALHALRRERPFMDFENSTRYIDYALLTQKGPIAIELNGESFHHPGCVGIDRYRSQLFKQNSLVMSGWRVFRWSLRGMKDSDRFIEEMRRFFGPLEHFKKTPQYMACRSLDVFRLMEHQEEALAKILEDRQKGKNTFLIVLPTGTGKTEVFMEDFRRLKSTQPALNGLILVPKLTLRDQTLERLRLRLRDYQHSVEFLPRAEGSGFMVQTFQHMVRHFESFPADAFDYVVVDEAHHAAAAGLRGIIEHFHPQVLIGVTATDERLDQKRLENIFGSYETNMSLQNAIGKGLLPPVRAFRINTNVDLSDVRFNGVDYVQADLQRTLLVRSRDEIVANVLEKYFGAGGITKQGVVFCVNVRHSKEMAKLLNQLKLRAVAISGEDKKAAAEGIQAYHDGKVQFLCACELLSEGWDAPQTAVLVMARPTMSKVLYVQQLGRGTRSHPGKEALYVLDVVDKHGPLNAPWSVHTLFGLKLYQPWADVAGNTQPEEQQEQEILLDWLHEEERRVTELDIFTFQQKYEGYLNEEQLARELFVSTGTIKTWLKKSDISPNVTVPFGNRQLHYFSPEQVAKIRELKGLRIHDETTQFEDYFDFLDERDYTYSYKMIFLLALLTCANARGEAIIETLTELYRGFYMDRIRQHLPVDREGCPYNQLEYLEDIPALTRNILANPFEKFERKRFMHHCKDLAYLAWHTSLWKRFTADRAHRNKMFKQMAEDLIKYYQSLRGLGDVGYLRRTFPKIGPYLPEEITGEAPARGIIRLVEFDPVTAYKSCLPFYPLEVAAGAFVGGDSPEPDGWIDVASAGFNKRLSQGMFVTRIVGKSMQPTIADGSLCVFHAPVEGSRQGLVVLVQKRGFTDPETGGSYTVKRYRSTKSATDENWRHETIELVPDNKDYTVLKFDRTGEDDLRVVAELVSVLEFPENDG